MAVFLELLCGTQEPRVVRCVLLGNFPGRHGLMAVPTDGFLQQGRLANIVSFKTTANL